MKLGILYDSCGGSVGGQVTKNQQIIHFFANQKDELNLCDVYGLGRRKLLLLWKKLRGFCRENDTIILILGIYNFPYIIMLLYMLIKEQKIFYLCIGGNNHIYLKKHPIVRRFCKIITATYAETEKHRKEMQDIGFKNVKVMPTCRDFKEYEAAKWKRGKEEPFSVCTYSRVCEEKGIGIAIEAVEKANQILKRKAYVLTVYGPVANDYKEEFFSLLKKFKETVQYKGCINTDEACDILSQQYLLLFPTKHKGEGFPSTVLEAYTAGLPIIASNQNALPDIIKENITGYVVCEPYVDEISKRLAEIANHPECIDSMRELCIEEAKKYDTPVILKKLRDDMERENGK